MKVMICPICGDMCSSSVDGRYWHYDLKLQRYIEILPLVTPQEIDND